jgi:hypothetical protein
VYYQRFEWSNGLLISECEPYVEEIQHVKSLLKSGDVLVGTGVSRFISQENDGILSLDALTGFSATQLLDCVAHQKEETGWMRHVDLATFEPDYLGSPV